MASENKFTKPNELERIRPYYEQYNTEFLNALINIAPDIRCVQAQQISKEETASEKPIDTAIDVTTCNISGISWGENSRYVYGNEYF